MKTHLDEIIQEDLVFVLRGLSGDRLASSLLQTLVVCLGLWVMGLPRGISSVLSFCVVREEAVSVLVSLSCNLQLHC